MTVISILQGKRAKRMKGGAEWVVSMVGLPQTNDEAIFCQPPSPRSCIMTICDLSRPVGSRLVRFSTRQRNPRYLAKFVGHSGSSFDPGRDQWSQHHLFLSTGNGDSTRREKNQHGEGDRRVCERRTAGGSLTPNGKRAVAKEG